MDLLVAGRDTGVPVSKRRRCWRCRQSHIALKESQTQPGVYGCLRCINTVRIRRGDLPIGPREPFQTKPPKPPEPDHGRYVNDWTPR